MRLLVFVISLLMNAMLGKGIRVLVVDDNEDVRQVISDRLEQIGFAVVPLKNDQDHEEMTNLTWSL